MTAQTLNKAIVRLAEIMEVPKESVMADLQKKNAFRWQMIEEIAEKI